MVSFDPWFFIPARSAVDNECASKRRDGNGKLKLANLEPFSSLRFFFSPHFPGRLRVSYRWTYTSFIFGILYYTLYERLLTTVQACHFLTPVQTPRGYRFTGLNRVLHVQEKLGGRQYQPSDLINFIRGGFHYRLLDPTYYLIPVSPISIFLCRLV